MKIIVTGSLGHISKPLAQQLIQKGHAVTVVSSDPGKQAAIEALNAVAAIGSLEDTAFLTQVFTGADIAYCMVPPAYYRNPAIDPTEYCRRIGDNYAQAIRDAGLKRIVQLSSFGAELVHGTGLILPYHHIEQVLRDLPGVSVTHMRPASFYYNLYGFLEMIRHTGMIAANYGGTDVVPWVAPVDIAAAVVEEMELPPAGNKIRYVASEELSCNEVAHVLGAAIGKPDLQWNIITDEEMYRGLIAAGMPEKVAAGLVELQACMHSGALAADYYRNRPAVMGNLKMRDFAKEFAAVFNGKR